MRLAADAGLGELAGELLSVPTDKGANPGGKVTALVRGMVAGANSIDDMALLRHGAMGRLFDRTYAPSTLGSFLREFTFGHLRQLDAVTALAVMASNLTGAAGTLTGGRFIRTTTGTIRRTLISVPARITSSALSLTLHLPQDRPWETQWTELCTRTSRPPPGRFLTIRPSRPRPRTCDTIDTRSDTQSRPHSLRTLQVNSELRRPADRRIEVKRGSRGRSTITRAPNVPRNS